MVSFSKIEEKWQKRWAKAEIFKVKANSKKKKYYVLEMFPYPSGSGLHMGHARNYTIGDIYARFQRMNGLNVLYPMGYDALGLPAENAAIKAKSHPKIFTEKAISNFIKQQKELGLSYDWDRMIATSYSDYYRWNQYFFLKFMEKGLVYRKKAAVNWCPMCNTVLANEQVHDGRCWRHKDTEVEIKQLEQWFIKTTKYANELLNDLPKLNWPDRIKTMQENWIGKSYGTEINFKINGKPWRIFTTRPDTIYGVTFMVISAQNPYLMELVSEKQKPEMEAFLKKIRSTKQEDVDKLEKEGVFTGSYAENPLTGEKIPVWAGNFVVADYGAGMVMAVPAHDQRDFEFAKKYDIPIKVVIQTQGKDLNSAEMDKAYMSEGVLVNSDQFDGMNSKKAIEEISKFVERKKFGKRTVQFKLKDWLVSRQRYWGTPIPVIYCDKCGIVPVPEKNLPIKLPEDVTFGEGNPLKTSKSFVNVKCPKCKGKGRRETDTMDTFFDSSWYYLRYCDSKNSKQPFDKKKVDYWMPVDQYVGGAEHACMHLIYARFFTKALRDLKFLKFDEPFTKLFNQGMLHGSDGFVMSKSRGNVILPEEISKKYGIDTARFFLMFIASPEKDMAWSDEGIEGAFKAVNKIYYLLEKKRVKKSSKKILNKMHRAIKNVTENTNEFKYNLALINLMDYVNYLNKLDEISEESLETLIKLISPYLPHIAEEMWSKLKRKGFVSLAKWPKFDKKKISDEIEAIENIISQTTADIISVMRLSKIEKPKKIMLFVSEKWKYKFFKDLAKAIQKTRNVGEVIRNVMDKKHAKEIGALVPRLVKDPSRIPKVALKQEAEINALKEAKHNIEKEFKLKLVIVKAEDSEESKAKQAMPGKPAILIM